AEGERAWAGAGVGAPSQCPNLVHTTSETPPGSQATVSSTAINSSGVATNGSGAWGRLTKWVGVGSGGSPLAPSLRKTPPSAATAATSWFSGPGGSRVGKGALGRAAGSLSPPRVLWGDPRGRQPVTRRDMLRADLCQYRQRLEEVQCSIADKVGMYATFHHSYTHARVEAEEAEELKRALSSQLVQLL
ncbi:unnamed protein product, partial [Discosporangium mesarthrocarpum]